MRRSKSYEVRNPVNIWNKYDFVMSGLGKKSKTLAKIKHFFKCTRWSKQRITRGYCDYDVWEMFSFSSEAYSGYVSNAERYKNGITRIFGRKLYQ